MSKIQYIMVNIFENPRITLDLQQIHQTTMSEESKLKRFWKTFGPGIMFAGTCIGGSHLVQSTKAGAFFGFGLLAIVLVANFFKYPFFEFASRYTNATGNSILEGYKKLGNWTLWLYGTVTIFSMFIISAAIGALASGLLENMVGSFTGFELEKTSWPIWPAILFLIVFLILASGKFGVLDLALKLIGIILVVTVTIAFFSVIGKPFPHKSPSTWSIVSDLDGAGFAFTIFLMGWMPMGVDMSTWHSLWTQERIKQTKYHPTLKETLLDFNIGYGITVVLAIFFLTIGAYSLFQNPNAQLLPTDSGLVFSKKLVNMFVSSVGPWSNFIIILAAFATMFGTAITLIDGYCRSVVRIVKLLQNKDNEEDSKFQFLIIVGILMVGSYIMIATIGGKLATILNLATATSFVIAPLAAWLNYRIIYNKEVDQSFRPKKALKTLAIAGIIFLSIFTLLYFYYLATK